MDTKWKKSKQIISFGCFFLGVTLLICSLGQALRLWRYSREALGSVDYQETAEFRSYMADRLEELLGITTGGKGWRYYGTSDRDAYRNYYIGDAYSWNDEKEMLDRGLNEGTAVQEAEADEIPREYALESAERQEILWDEEYDAYSEYWGRPKNKKEYMAELAQNKNIRYAVIWQGKLAYTNIEAWEERLEESWKDADFYKDLDPEEYNFTLWYNRAGDGKVQIVKDNVEEEIYGSGMYTDDSRWFVPGYANFNVDASAKDAVIFLAAAKEPRLYITGNYSEYGTSQYGGRLYYLQQRLTDLHKSLQIHCAFMAAGVVLLAVSFLWRKEKRKADQAIAALLGKIWLELKLLLFVLLPVLIFLMAGREELREMLYLLWYDGYPGDVIYFLGQVAGKGLFLCSCFWLVYLLVLDLRLNRGKQKKPLFDSLRTRDLQYPVQKRMVRRYWLILASVISVLVLAVLLLILVIWLDNQFDYYGSFYTLFAMTAAVLLAVILLAVCVAVGVGSLGKNRRLAEDIGALSDQITAVRGGNLTKPLVLPKDADLAQAAESLNEIQRGLEEALREQMHSERMKVELVTNVSHDIKTPLTSIISYVELLKQEEALPEHVREFVQILWEKSLRLKTIVQDVFDVSKAAAGQLPVNMEELDLGRLLRQVLADMDSQIASSGLGMKTAVSEEPLFIRADGQRLYRVFQNLLQNALKYSLAGSRIYLTMTMEGVMAAVYLKNTSGTELETGKDFAERFVRGDSSRTDGGSGLGLSIAKSFTEACGGSFRVETDADLFTVVVAFPMSAK
ncbi:MAG: HAMP domain-containing histidine kinase [Lachnospiraceae bacterium]|nr:HAMP domain-containing histidine kinase [Lachnospiraceae bacterium]